MGFTGFIVSDWESIHKISVNALKEQATVCINAGIDMLMEQEKTEECAGYIVEAVSEGSITEERADDAAGRILNVKIEAGLFGAPMRSRLGTKQSDAGSEEYRVLAAKLAEESLVSVKNENDVLPIQDGSSVCIFKSARDPQGRVERRLGGRMERGGVNERRQHHPQRIRRTVRSA